MKKLLLLLLFISSLGGEKISVIIPCHYKHFELIPNHLTYLSKQSLIPDEVVISVSEAHKVPDHLWEEIKSYPYELIILPTNEKKSPGENRNIAALASSGDIIITEDADDLPHPQRIEIIAYFMTANRAVHLIHQWLPEEGDIAYYQNFRELSQMKINSIPIRKYKNVHNGNIAIRKEVLAKVLWTNARYAEDIKFNKNVLRQFHNSLFIEAPLIIYRSGLSSFRKESSVLTKT